VNAFINQTINWMVPLLLLGGWALYEVTNVIRIRKGGESRKLTAWLLRPWAVWACLSLVYQLNPGKGMEAVETAPSFNPWLFPFFVNSWTPEQSFTSILWQLFTTPTVYGWGAVVAVLGLLLFFLIRRLFSGPPLTGKKTAAFLVGLYLLAGVLPLTVASLPDGAWDSEERKGSLLSCWHAHATVLYAAPFVQSTGQFLRDYAEIHPRLRFTIHAYSHPPGAALSMAYIGKAVGADGMNIRLDSTRLRYSFGMAFFAALNIFVLFGLGKSIFGTNKHGLVAAILWAVSPAVMAYSPHTQDGLYAVFFNLTLLLSWRIGMAKQTPWIEMLGLGLVFSCLNFLNFSWVLTTSIFALFLLYRWMATPWTFRKLALRGIPPLGLMTLLTGSILLTYKLNYWAAYQTSTCYVQEWYQFDTVYQHVIAWIGGQVEVSLMMGAITCSAFWAGYATRIKQWRVDPAAVFLTLILTIYLLPVLFGPTCLRLETARCWLWVPSVPICFAASHLLTQSRPRRFVTAAALVSLISYTLMRLFLNAA
jgi:hypothetical protein